MDDVLSAEEVGRMVNGDRWRGIFANNLGRDVNQIYHVQVRARVNGRLTDVRINVERTYRHNESDCYHLWAMAGANYVRIADIPVGVPVNGPAVGEAAVVKNLYERAFSSANKQ
jgi:hypothetical protein